MATEVKAPDLEVVASQELAARDIRTIRILYETGRAVWFLGRQNGALVEIEACDRLACDNTALNAYALEATTMRHPLGRPPAVIDGDRGLYLIRPHRRGEPIWQALLRPGRFSANRLAALLPGLSQALSTIDDQTPLPMIYLGESEVTVDGTIWGPWAHHGEIVRIIDAWSHRYPDDSAQKGQQALRRLYGRLISGSWQPSEDELNAAHQAGTIADHELRIYQRLAKHSVVEKRSLGRVLRLALACTVVLGIAGGLRVYNLTRAEGWQGATAEALSAETSQNIRKTIAPVPVRTDGSGAVLKQRAFHLVRLAQAGQYVAFEDEGSELISSAKTAEDRDLVKQAIASARQEIKAAVDDELALIEALFHAEEFDTALARLDTFRVLLPLVGAHRDATTAWREKLVTAIQQRTDQRARHQRARLDQYRLECDILERLKVAMLQYKGTLRRLADAHALDLETRASRELVACMVTLDEAEGQLMRALLSRCAADPAGTYAAIGANLPASSQGTVTAVDRGQITITTQDRVISRRWREDLSPSQKLAIWHGVLRPNRAAPGPSALALRAYAQLHKVPINLLGQDNSCAAVRERLIRFLKAPPSQD